ncbi:unnamed protein product [Protopolystoma xenopodis]|uniref:Uncharacterized protein n=1 Tax=Protopolystoma xenopodis TaxID=117903 RepID=A0A448WI66_9PLAT|nr:unnamed protein product [Protopolystoma xenopodis]
MARSSSVPRPGGTDLSCSRSSVTSVKESKKNPSIPSADLSREVGALGSITAVTIVLKVGSSTYYGLVPASRPRVYSRLSVPLLCWPHRADGPLHLWRILETALGYFYK